MAFIFLNGEYVCKRYVGVYIYKFLEDKNDASFAFLEDSFHQFGSKQHLFFIFTFLFYVYGCFCTILI